MTWHVQLEKKDGQFKIVNLHPDMEAHIPDGLYTLGGHGDASSISISATYNDADRVAGSYPGRYVSCQGTAIIAPSEG